MPNWCNNDISLVHDDKEKLKEVEKILKTNVEGECKFFNYCKEEPDYEKTIVKETYPEISGQEFCTDDKRKWWHWRVQNWGTKWNIDPVLEDRITRDDDYLGFMCETAWSPPLEALIALEEKGFKVTCEYYEMGCAFVGKYETGFGDMSWTLPNTLAELRDMMSKDQTFNDLVYNWGIDVDYEEMENDRLPEEPQEPTRIN